MPPRANTSPPRSTRKALPTFLTDEPPRRKVAVVGSGVAGLSAAFLLSRKHDVHIFEREEVVGMDAHSLSAHGARMDIPLRVFSESYYPNLCNLYRLVGVKYRIADYSFSCLGGVASSTSAYFRYINLFVSGMALPVPACFNPRQWAKCVRLGYNVRPPPRPQELTHPRFVHSQRMFTPKALPLTSSSILRLLVRTAVCALCAAFAGPLGS